LACFQRALLTCKTAKLFWPRRSLASAPRSLDIQKMWFRSEHITQIMGDAKSLCERILTENYNHTDATQDWTLACEYSDWWNDYPNENAENQPHGKALRIYEGVDPLANDVEVHPLPEHLQPRPTAWLLPLLGDMAASTTRRRGRMPALSKKSVCLSTNKINKVKFLNHEENSVTLYKLLVYLPVRRLFRLWFLINVFKKCVLKGVFFRLVTSHSLVTGTHAMKLPGSRRILIV
jgi:hypothetical protein